MCGNGTNGCTKAMMMMVLDGGYRKGEDTEGRDPVPLSVGNLLNYAKGFSKYCYHLCASIVYSGQCHLDDPIHYSHFISRKVSV